MRVIRCIVSFDQRDRQVYFVLKYIIMYQVYGIGTYVVYRFGESHIMSIRLVIIVWLVSKQTDLAFWSDCVMTNTKINILIHFIVQHTEEQ